MTIDEARDECRRWLAYMDRRREQSAEMRQLAGERRAGRSSATEAARRLRQIEDAGRVVYDGAELERAVRVLLEASE